MPLAIFMSLLMWGVVYQGYNAIFPSFYPELFPTRTRVSAMAISQNIGTTITALLPALFAAVAPPGSGNIPLTVGAITFGVTIIAAIAALSARETYRVHLNDLGNAGRGPRRQGGLRQDAGGTCDIWHVGKRTRMNALDPFATAGMIEPTVRRHYADNADPRWK